MADDIWHHVCVVWEGENGVLAFLKDGEGNINQMSFEQAHMKWYYDQKMISFFPSDFETVFA